MAPVFLTTSSSSSTLWSEASATRRSWRRMRLSFSHSSVLSVEDYIFVRRHIEPDLRRRQDGRGRPPIGIDLIMATALVFLAHGTTYLVTSALMRNGLSEATTLRCIRLFTKSVCARLKPSLITLPTSIAAFEQCARAFMRRSGIPNIIGAIDGSHIRVAPPKRHQKSYFNRKKFYSVILSAVCDARGAFLSCDVGFPGRMGDSRVLKYVRTRARGCGCALRP